MDCDFGDEGHSFLYTVDYSILILFSANRVFIYYINIIQLINNNKNNNCSQITY